MYIYRNYRYEVIPDLVEDNPEKLLIEYSERYIDICSNTISHSEYKNLYAYTLTIPNHAICPLYSFRYNKNRRRYGNLGIYEQLCSINSALRECLKRLNKIHVLAVFGLSKNGVVHLHATVATNQTDNYVFGRIHGKLREYYDLNKTPIKKIKKVDNMSGWVTYLKKNFREIPTQKVYFK